MIPERDDRSNAEIRSDALVQHDEVRVAVRTVLVAIQSVENAGAHPDALRLALTELGIAVRRMHAYETAALEPALRTLDAWGERRVDELHAQRDVQSSRTPLPSSSRDELLREARSSLRAVVRALRLEEQGLLAEALWSNNIVNLDPD